MFRQKHLHIQHHKKTRTAHVTAAKSNFSSFPTRDEIQICHDAIFLMLFSFIFSPIYWHLLIHTARPRAWIVCHSLPRACRSRFFFSLSLILSFSLFSEFLTNQNWDFSRPLVFQFPRHISRQFDSFLNKFWFSHSDEFNTFSRWDEWRRDQSLTFPIHQL